jgi:hypothetical protein
MAMGSQSVRRTSFGEKSCPVRSYAAENAGIFERLWRFCVNCIGKVALEFVGALWISSLSGCGATSYACAVR